MPQYMIQFAYSAQGWAALIQNPVDRSDPLRALAEKLGGHLVSLHHTMGEFDGVALLDAPDDTTAMAVVMGATAPGHLRATKTTRLYTPAESIDAMRRAGGAAFGAPTEAGR